VKLRELVRHLEAHGCYLLREGSKHTQYLNPANKKHSSVPRHNEIYRKKSWTGLYRH